MKKINFITPLMLFPTISFSCIVASCQNSYSKVSIENKTDLSTMGGTGSYVLNFQQEMIYEPWNNKFSVPVVSFENVRAFDENNDEVILPYGATYLFPVYDYQNNNRKLVVNAVPSDTCTSYLKYILKFSFDINVKWKTINDLSLIDTQLQDWEQTIENCGLEYIGKISMPNKSIVMERGETRASVNFKLFTTVDKSKQKIKIIPHTKTEGLAIYHMESSITIGNGYINSSFSFTNVKNIDLIDADASFDIACYDINNIELWSQTINNVKITILQNKFNTKDFIPQINPSASEIVAAGEKGLDYSFDLYLYDKYDSFNANMWIDASALSPYTKSIKFVKYEFLHDTSQDADYIKVTMNIVAAKEIGVGKTEVFKLRMTTDKGWDHLLNLTMWCDF